MFFAVVPHERPCPRKKKKRNHLHTLHYLSSFHESAKTTAITSILEGTLPVRMTRYKEIHHHGINAVFNPSHKHSNMLFPEKKFSYFGEGNMKKNLISHWNKQLPYQESNCFHWADKPHFNPLKLDFRLFFKPCRELLWNIHEDRACKFKACMYCYNKKNVAIPNK